MKIEELSLSALKYFIDAVELGGITLSAERNNISRPAVSQAILRLEQWYGKALLEHEKRSFVLTSHGKDFYQLARRSFNGLAQGFSEKRGDEKSLKMGCSASLVDLIFPNLEKFIKKASDPIIKTGSTDQLIRSLQEGLIHIAFAVGKGNSTEFKSYPIHSGFFQLLSKSGVLEATLITTEERPETESFKKYLVQKKISFQSHMRVESWSVALRLAQLGIGCCLVPDFVAGSGLTRVKTSGWESGYSVVALTQKSHLLSVLEDEIMQFLTN